jgi:predicted glycosyltransferase
MVLVTAGGGEDGYSLIRNYLDGLVARRNDAFWKTVIVTGPELAESHKREVRRVADRCIDVQVIEFTDHLMDYMRAADVVVSMAGYNTVCEILSLRKRAVIVPRIKPVQEQKIRAERMASLGVFQMIGPEDLTPVALIEAVEAELDAFKTCPLAPARIELDALPRISDCVTCALTETKKFGRRNSVAGHGR